MFKCEQERWNVAGNKAERKDDKRMKGWGGGGKDISVVGSFYRKLKQENTRRPIHLHVITQCYIRTVTLERLVRSSISAILLFPVFYVRARQQCALADV